MRFMHKEHRRYRHDDRHRDEYSPAHAQPYLDFDPIGGMMEASADRAIVRLPGRRIRKPRPEPFLDYDAV